MKDTNMFDFNTRTLIETPWCQLVVIIPVIKRVEPSWTLIFDLFKSQIDQSEMS